MNSNMAGMRWSAVLVTLFACNDGGTVEPIPEPSVSPVYNQIVFESDRDDPNGDLYLMNLDGANVKRLASSGFADRCPAFSPDGKRIAFYSARLGNQLGVFVMHSDGTSIRYIDGPVRNEQCPRWSADGSRIGYIRDDRSAKSPLGVLRVSNRDGSGVRTLDSAAAFVGPAFSPNGDRVIYNRYDSSTDTARTGAFVVSMLDNSRKKLGSVVAGYREDANLDWSRDGTWVLFDCIVSPPFGAGLCLSHADGSNRVMIPYPFTGGNFQDTRFSPDGALLVYANLDVSVMPRTGSPRTYLHDGITPTWLSDGSAVGFVSPPKFPDPEPFNPADIFVGNRDGTGVRNLTKHPAKDVHPSWSPVQR